jgi:gliding motility-associated-like protein
VRNGSDFDTISITVAKNPTASITPSNTQTICSTGSRTFTANTNAGNVSYQWRLNGSDINGATMDTYSATDPGIYRVDITNNLTGCTATSAGVTLNVISPDVSNISLPGPLCEGETGTFMATKTPDANSVIWTFGDGSSATGENVTHTYSTAGTFNVEITVVQGNCSTTVQAGSVIVNPGPETPQLTASPDELCEDEVFLFETNGVSSGTVQWNFGDGNTGQGDTFSHSYESEGSYTVWVYAQDGVCFSDTVTETVDVNASPRLQDLAPLEKICSGDPFEVKIGGSTTGGTPTYSYAWSPAIGLDDASAANPIVTVNNDTVYKVVVEDANGCKDSAEVTVEVYDMPVIDSLFVKDPTTCNPGDKTGRIQVIGAGELPLRHNLYRDGILEKDGVITNNFPGLEEGSYLIEVRYKDLEDGRCMVSETVNLAPPGAPDLEIIGDATACIGDTVSFMAMSMQDSVDYQWDFGPNAQPMQAEGEGPHLVVFDTEGTENISVTANRNDCNAPRVFSVNVISKAILTIDGIDLATQPVFEVFDQNPFSFEIASSVPDLVFSWTATNDSGRVKSFISSGDSNQIMDAVELEEGSEARITYQITAGEGACAAIEIFYVDIFLPLSIPNLVTPNGDGFNETWDISIKDTDNLDPTKFKVEIFNRVGAKVYQGRLDGAAWEGTDCPDGSYWYIITDESNGVNYKGVLTLLRS